MGRKFNILLVCLALASCIAWAPMATAQNSDYGNPESGDELLGGLIGGILDGLLGDLDELLGTLDAVLVDVVGVLPLPILGPDAYEPDDSWENANFVELLVGDLLDTVTTLLPFLKTHNFHTADDEDWHQFYAQEEELLVIQTLNLYPGADTFLTVYRVWSENEALPTTPPEGCNEAFVSMSDGTILIPIACNDDAEGGFSPYRSRVAFIAPTDGLYYSRITQSPKSQTKRAGEDDGGADTTYQYMASSQGFFGGSLHVNVRSAMDSKPIENASVEIYPLGGKTRENTDGTYSFHGIPEGHYQYRVTATDYKPYVSFADVEDGKIKFVYCALIPDDEEEEETDPQSEVIEGEDNGSYSDEYGSTIAPASAHSADFKAPYGKFSISEILRVIQFLNLGGYGCDTANEDGYAALGTDQSCAPHGADNQPQDWKIGLSETLRVIQLYNFDSYAPCEDTEDGFCPVLR